MKLIFENQEKNFLQQQGFEGADPGACSAKYGPLQFQPRVVGVWFLVSAMSQWSFLFFLLSLALVVSATFPQWNPFEMIYNRTLARRPGGTPLGLAPAPRRFAQAVAGGLTLLIALCLWARRPLWAYMLEFVMAGALIALIFTGFCFGAILYFALRGQWDFAKKTLPWA